MFNREDRNYIIDTTNWSALIRFYSISLAVVIVATILLFVI